MRGQNFRAGDGKKQDGLGRLHGQEFAWLAADLRLTGLPPKGWAEACRHWRDQRDYGLQTFMDRKLPTKDRCGCCRMKIHPNQKNFAEVQRANG